MNKTKLLLVVVFKNRLSLCVISLEKNVWPSLNEGSYSNERTQSEFQFLMCFISIFCTSKDVHRISMSTCDFMFTLSEYVSE